MPAHRQDSGLKGKGKGKALAPSQVWLHSFTTTLNEYMNILINNYIYHYIYHEIY